MPTLYIRPAIQLVKIKPRINKTIDNTNSHKGGSKGNLPIITIGDVNGIIEHQNASELSGFSSMVCRAINEKINGMVIGSINCWESVSESTAEPTAANNEP